MKAKINSKGGLEVYAENDLESFALRIWLTDSLNEENNRKYTMSVDYSSYNRTEIANAN